MVNLSSWLSWKETIDSRIKTLFGTKLIFRTESCLRIDCKQLIVLLFLGVSEILLKCIEIFL